jgi:hypothetical protein
MMEAYNITNLIIIGDTFSRGRDDFEDTSTYGRIILRFILVKYSGRVQTEFKWLKNRVQRWTLVNKAKFSGFMTGRKWIH